MYSDGVITKRALGSTRSLASFTLSILALLACGQDFSSAGEEGGSSQGAGTTSSGTGGSAGGTTSSGGGSPPVDCPQDTVYAPPLPAGWEGPFIVAPSPDEGSLPGCPESGGQVLMVGLQQKKVKIEQHLKPMKLLKLKLEKTDLIPSAYSKMY